MNNKLRSTNQDFYWGKVTLASCSHGCEIDECLKNHNCQCGLYSLKELNDFHDGYRVSSEVYGRVSLQGVVVEFEKGYRSSMATIETFFADDEVIVLHLRYDFPGIEVLPLPDSLKPVAHSARNYNESWERKQKAIKARDSILENNKHLFPGGMRAEQDRVAAILRNKTAEEVVAWAKDYAESGEWIARTWAWKPENSKKYRPGTFVFSANNDVTPYIFIGSTRARGDYSSSRLLLTRDGMLVKRANIRNWNEDPNYRAARANAIANW